MSQKKKRWNSFIRLFSKQSPKSKPVSNKTTTSEVFVIGENSKEVFEFEENSKDIFVVEETPKEYKVLGLEENVSDIEVKRRFRYLIKQYHPDSGGDPKEFIKIKRAYEKIKQRRSTE